MLSRLIGQLQSFGLIPISSKSSCGVSNQSRLGAHIFYHQGRDQIVKIGNDPAYDVFVRWARAQPGLRVPRFYCHLACGKVGAYGAYTYTRMERLELTPTEGEMFCAWYVLIIGRARAGESFASMTDCDPLGLLETIAALSVVAKQAALQAGSVVSGYDLSKPENVMVRIVAGERIMVLTDPLN